MFFRKKQSPPVGHKDDLCVAMEASICTGETLIGFKNERGRLEQAVVVRCQEDIDEFYAAHDLINSGRIKWKK